MKLAIGRVANRTRLLKGFGVPMHLPCHDIISTSARPYGFGPVGRSGLPLQQDISGKYVGNTVSNSALARPYRAANGNVAAAAGLSDDAWVSYIRATDTHYYALDYTALNAITSGDFHIRFRVYLSTAPVSTNTYYLLSIQDAGASAAGTAWGVVAGLAGTQALVAIVSDGVTRSVYGSGGAHIAAAGWYDIVLERASGTLYGYVNGTRRLSQAYSSTLNIPSGAKLRIGKPVGAFGSNIDHVYFDFVQVKRRSLFAGAATCTTTTYPFPN